MAYKQQTFISHDSGGWKSDIRLSAWLGSSESPVMGFRLLTFIPSQEQKAERRSKFCCDSYKSTNRIHKGSNLMISSNPMYPSKSSPSNVILGSSVSMYEFGIWNSYEYEFSNWQSLTFGKIKGLKQGGILIFILSSCFGNPFSGPQPLGHGLVPVQSR